MLSKYRFTCALIVLALGFTVTQVFAADKGLTSHTDMISMLTALDEEDNASGRNRLTIGSLGKSVRGRDIALIQIADPAVPVSEMKRIFVICRQHGDEPATTEGMLKLTRDLVRAEDEENAGLLSKVAFFIVPMLNPDGAEAFKRRNARGADLNRDWIDLSEPETKAVRAAIDSVMPDVLIDAHELSPTNRRTDFVESAGPKCGATEAVIKESEYLQSLVIGILRTHDMTVRSERINDRHPARLAHRYFPIHAEMKTLLLETCQSGGRKNQLGYRMALHITGVMTIAKYLAGREQELVQRIADHDARKYAELASRSKKPGKASKGKAQNTGGR